MAATKSGGAARLAFASRMLAALAATVAALRLLDWLADAAGMHRPRLPRPPRLTGER